MLAEQTEPECGPKSMRRCEIWCGSSRAWPDNAAGVHGPRPSRPRAASNCSRAEGRRGWRTNKRRADRLFGALQWAISCARSDMIAGLMLAFGPEHRRHAANRSPRARRARDAASPATRRIGSISQGPDPGNAWRETLARALPRLVSSALVHEPSQAETVAGTGQGQPIPQLLGAIAALNERRSGRSDRSADFPHAFHLVRRLCQRPMRRIDFARAGPSALNPARHFFAQS